MNFRLHFLLCIFIAFMLQGCFIFQSSSSSDSTAKNTQSNAKSSSLVTTLCNHKWIMKRGKSEEYIYDNNCNYIRSVVREDKTLSGDATYVIFYSDNTCIESGLWGDNGSQRRTWSLKGNKLTIYGHNLTVGEEITNNVTFTIESLNSNYLQMKRKIGGRTCTSGSEFYRTLYFN